MSMNSKTRRVRLQRLFDAQQGKCHWRQRETLPPGHENYYRKNGTTLAGNAATIDHLYSRLHPQRQKPPPGPRIVMACHTCNGKRSKIECIAAHMAGSLEPRTYRPDEAHATRRERRAAKHGTFP